MKKLKALIFSAIVMILMAATVISISAAENGKVRFEVAQTQAVNGCAEVVVNLTENEGMAGFRLRIEYDNSILTPNSVTKSSIIKSGYFITNFEQDEETSYITVFWSNASNVTDVGELFAISFTVLDAEFDETLIHLEYNPDDIADQYYNNLDVTLIDGKVIREVEDDNQESAVGDYTISSLSGDVSQSKFYASVSVTKNTDREADDYIIIVIYSDGTLYDMTYWKTGLNENQSVVLSGRMYGCDGAQMKAFVWDSLGGMKSLSNVMTMN